MIENIFLKSTVECSVTLYLSFEMVQMYYIEREDNYHWHKFIFQG